MFGFTGNCWNSSDIPLYPLSYFLQMVKSYRTRNTTGWLCLHRLRTSICLCVSPCLSILATYMLNFRADLQEPSVREVALRIWFPGLVIPDFIHFSYHVTTANGTKPAHCSMVSLAGSLVHDNHIPWEFHQPEIKVSAKTEVSRETVPVWFLSQALWLFTKWCFLQL